MRTAPPLPPSRLSPGPRRSDCASPTPARAVALLAALFAVTFNLLQPLAHAASMRDGAPGSIWSALCNASAADPASTSDTATVDQADAAPIPAAVKHECCLGLAQAPSMVAPSAAFIALPPIATALAPSLPAARVLAFAIRDGPTRPRGPPSLD